jgi:Ca-activated chloride channel family protein
MTTFGDEYRPAGGADGPVVTLEARPEGRLLPPGGGARHVDFRLRVAGRDPGAAGAGRAPLRLALVLDRSGSMAGWKLETVKRAALAALDRLDGHDRVAVVVFDHQVDIVQPAAPVTPELKAWLGAALAGLESGGSTALHQGWLAGCRAVAAATTAVAGDAALARCFLLTDGLANVGLTDPERIAAGAADVREREGVGTSTFGIGADYDEALLGPMAVAGGGQFHHLRTAEDLARTFAGELGELLAAAAAPSAHLELEAGAGVTADVVSAYWVPPAAPSAPGADGGGARWSVALGDLVAGEERHVVVRFGFPPAPSAPDGTHAGPAGPTVRARVTWTAAGEAHATAWREVAFAYASPAACATEPRAPEVLHWVGLHHAARALLEATRSNRAGDLFGARRMLWDAIRHLEAYASGDPDLEAALDALRAYEPEVAAGPLASAVAKESAFDAQRRSRGKFDYR